MDNLPDTYKQFLAMRGQTPDLVKEEAKEEEPSELIKSKVLERIANKFSLKPFIRLAMNKNKDDGKQEDTDLEDQLPDSELDTLPFSVKQQLFHIQ